MRPKPSLRDGTAKAAGRPTSQLCARARLSGLDRVTGSSNPLRRSDGSNHLLCGRVYASSVGRETVAVLTLWHAGDPATSARESAQLENYAKPAAPMMYAFTYRWHQVRRSRDQLQSTQRRRSCTKVVIYPACNLPTGTPLVALARPARRVSTQGPGELYPPI